MPNQEGQAFPGLPSYAKHWRVDETVLNDLPPVYRVALGSARTQDRVSFAALFALDARLARAVAEASEPIIAQMKLAWWRDRFSDDPARWPVGEPLLAQLTAWGGAAANLGKLVDGYEELIAGTSLTPAGAERFAEGRRASWETLASVVGVPSQRSAMVQVSWAYTQADLSERGLGAILTEAEPDAVSGQTRRLPRPLRPFAVLGNLGRRAVSKDRPMLDGFPSLALALRTGLTGL